MFKAFKTFKTFKAGEGVSKMDKLIYVMIIIVLIIVYVVISRLHWRMRSDNGFNMGRNYMRNLGFDDEDINRGQDDADAEFYIFREKQKHGKDAGKMDE